MGPAPAPSKAPVTALLRWLLLYPVVAGGVCFAIGAASVLGGQIAAGILGVAVGTLAGWEAAREGCSAGHCAGWAALAEVIALLACATGVGAAYETIYCDDRGCRPLFE